MKSFTDDELWLRLALVRECRLVHGIPAARALWIEVGLPLPTVSEVAIEHADLWVQPISAWLGDREKVRISDVACGALNLKKGSAGTSVQRRIARIMAFLGWQRLPMDSKGNRWWGKLRASNDRLLRAA